jgi:SAM-dependent MidA family methyltransferase
VTALELMIRDEIRARGPMRFDRYMELALHHPAHGYYAAGRPIGREGDFFTSVSVGPLFGQLLARQARQMWRALDCPRPFWIIEQGTHDGQLALDILESCRSGPDDFLAAVRYGIIEPSSSARKLQERRVTKAKLGERVCWMRDLREVRREKPIGIFLSNELVDAFPVHLIHRSADAWMERCVEVDDEGSLSWTDVSIQDEKLGEAIRGLPLPEIEGYVTEINLTARDWMQEVAKVFERGYVLTIDYGFPASLYYAPFRSGGTLTTYQDHRRDDDVLHSPGKRDITAHVDFTALVRAGESGGLTTLGLIDQQRFLMGVAQSELSGAEKYENGIPSQLRAWNTLTHPEHLGSRFQVLAQAKNAPGTLDGLRFARPGGLD